MMNSKKTFFYNFADAVAKFTRVAKPKAQNFVKNASVEMAPPSPGEFMGRLNILKNDLLSGKSVARASELTVNEMAAKGLVVAEVALIFYLGEMIGRKSIIGYNPKVEWVGSCNINLIFLKIHHYKQNWNFWLVDTEIW